MGYENVQETHGRQEFGKDIVCSKPSDFGGRQYYAVVAKAGDISAAAGGKANLAIVRDQINMAFQVPVEDVRGKQKAPVNEVIVWTTGNISDNAKTIIMAALDKDFRNVQFVDGDATIDLLERHYKSFFTIRDPYVSEYYASTWETYSRIEELRVLGCSSEQHQVSSIFVPPVLTPITRQHAKQTKQREKRYSFNNILRMSENTVILGDVGSGKSTLLRKMLLHIIESNEKAARRGPIPVLVNFKNLDLSDPQAIESALSQQFHRFCSVGTEQGLDEDLTEGSVIVLLDGLDELQSEERIETTLNLVREFSHRYPTVRIVLTSRLLDIFDQPTVLSGFRVLRINELSPSQMIEFVENWYGENSQAGRKLARLVSGPTALHGLPSTPLTLALVASLHESGQEIPANLTELFAKYVELALGRWDTGRDISLQIEWRIKQFFLRKISWSIHEQYETQITQSDFDKEVQRFSQERGIEELIPAILSKEITERSELLFSNDEGAYEFKHRSFQEYFVGLEIDSRPDAEQVIVNNFLDPWWSYATFFACGLCPDSENHLNRIMEQVTPSSSDVLVYSMNLGMVAQATYLAPKTVKAAVVNQVLDLLPEAWDKFCNNYAELDEKPKFKAQAIPHLFFVGVFGIIAGATLGSNTLFPVLSDLAEHYSSLSYDALSGREKKKAEWSAFFLAAACAECDNVTAFATLFESGVIKDPSFLAFGQFLAETIGERTWLPKEDISRAKSLVKRLGKKIDSYQEYWASIRHSDPLPLPPPDTSAQ